MMKIAVLFAAGFSVLGSGLSGFAPACAAETETLVVTQALITPAPSGSLRGNSAISGDRTWKPKRSPVLEKRRIETESYADRVPPPKAVRPNIPERRSFGQPRPKWAPRNPPWVHDQFDRLR